MLKNFRTFQLAVQFYHLSKNLKLPKYLADQLKRAASSVVLNLAEGAGRHTKADQKRFFDIAFGSLRESQAILDLTLDSSTEVSQLGDILAAHLFCLIKSCKR